MGTKYIVGLKTSFVHAGRSYKPGDEIDDSLFSKEALEANIKGAKLLTKAQAKEVFKEESENLPPSENAFIVQKALDSMNFKELKAFAAEKNISVSGNETEMRAAIRAACPDHP